jgi:hypothetical protein
MAIPRPNETARLIHLRRVVEDTDTEQMLAWPRPTDDDFAVFGRIIHTYSAIDFLLRFTAEITDAQGLLSKPWNGAIATQSIAVISRRTFPRQTKLRIWLPLSWPARKSSRYPL